MENVGFGQIVFLLLFVLVPLLRFVLRRLGERPQGQSPQNDSAPKEQRKREAPTASLVTPRSDRDPFSEAPVSPVAVPATGRWMAQRLLFKNHHDIRRGIIIMTILGPCRAFDPPE